MSGITGTVIARSDIAGQTFTKGVNNGLLSSIAASAGFSTNKYLIGIQMGGHWTKDDGTLKGPGAFNTMRNARLIFSETDISWSPSGPFNLAEQAILGTPEDSLSIPDQSATWFGRLASPVSIGDSFTWTYTLPAADPYAGTTHVAARHLWVVGISFLRPLFHEVTTGIAREDFEEDAEGTSAAPSVTLPRAFRDQDSQWIVGLIVWASTTATFTPLAGWTLVCPVEISTSTGSSCVLIARYVNDGFDYTAGGTLSSSSAWAASISAWNAEVEIPGPTLEAAWRVG